MSYDPIKVVEKKWGKEEILDITDKYCLKKITIFAGCSTSLQYHNQKMETSVIHSGKAMITRVDGAGFKIYEAAEAGYILRLKPKEIHRIAALEEVILYETSTSDEGFEFDVVRIEDSYGREGTNNP